VYVPARIGGENVGVEPGTYIASHIFQRRNFWRGNCLRYYAFHEM